MSSLNKSTLAGALFVVVIASCTGLHHRHHRPVMVQSIDYQALRDEAYLHHKHVSHVFGDDEQRRRHDALVGHVSRVESAFLKHAKGGYIYGKQKSKARSAVHTALKSAAVVVATGAMAFRKLKKVKAFFKTSTASTEQATTSTSSTEAPTTPSTSTKMTTPTTTTPTTTTPSTTTPSTTMSTTTTPSTTTTTAPSSTTPTTTTLSTTTPTTTTTPAPCGSTVSATNIGEMGDFSFARGGPETGNLKVCQTVAAPVGTKLSITCSTIDLKGTGKYLIISETNSNGADIANPPVQGTTYTSSSNVVYFEAFVSSSDTISCKWTVVAAFLRLHEENFISHMLPFL